MTEFKIDHGIPLPIKTNRGKYRFRDMKVGDSFFVPGMAQASIASAAGAFVRAHQKSWRFTTSMRVEKGQTGVRVWRVK